MNLSTSFRKLPFNVETLPLWLKHIYSVLRCWHGGPMQHQLVPDYVASFDLGGCICQKRYVIGVVRVRNCLCGISSASFLCQLEIVVFHLINRLSKYVVQRYRANVSPAAHLVKWWSSLWLHPGSGTFTFVFLYSIIMAATVLWVGRRRVVITPSSQCVWSQRPWRCRQIILLLYVFLHEHLQEVDG